MQSLLFYVCQVLVFLLPPILVAVLITKEASKDSKATSSITKIQSSNLLIRQIKLLVLGVSIGLSIDFILRLVADEVEYSITFIKLYHTIGLGILIALLLVIMVNFAIFLIDIFDIFPEKRYALESNKMLSEVQDFLHNDNISIAEKQRRIQKLKIFLIKNSDNYK